LVKVVEDVGKALRPHEHSAVRIGDLAHVVLGEHLVDGGDVVSDGARGDLHAVGQSLDRELVTALGQVSHDG